MHFYNNNICALLQKGVFIFIQKVCILFKTIFSKTYKISPLQYQNSFYAPAACNLLPFVKIGATLACVNILGLQRSTKKISTEKTEFLLSGYKTEGTICGIGTIFRNSGNIGAKSYIKTYNKLNEVIYYMPMKFIPF